MARAKASQAAGAGGDADMPQASTRALRVLSVEDNPFGRVVLNTILTELGHQAEFIGRGEAAVERIARGDFDAVLMDMVLPGIDGIEAIRRIRGLNSPLTSSAGRLFDAGVTSLAMSPCVIGPETDHLDLGALAEAAGMKTASPLGAQPPVGQLAAMRYGAALQDPHLAGTSS